jgi:hypothetical protein
VPFLIENRHFLIRKCRFGISGNLYVERYQVLTASNPLSGDTPMIRRKLLIVSTVIASIALAACSDMTAPKNDSPCPVINGSQTCVQ